jgi:hypothetical protein
VIQLAPFRFSRHKVNGAIASSLNSNPLC